MSIGRTAPVLIGRTAVDDWQVLIDTPALAPEVVMAPFDMKVAPIDETALFAAVLRIDDVVLTDKEV